MKTLTKLLPLLTGTLILAGGSLAGDTTKQGTAKADRKPTARKARIEWFSYDAGLAKAKKEGKPIIVNFYTDWCGYCKKMDRSTFKDPMVIEYLNAHFVGIRVNGDSKAMVSRLGERISERKLTQAYGVRGFPTFWFLDAEGKRIGPAPGYKPTASFLALLRYIGGSHYKTMSYESFLKKGAGKG